MFWNKRNKIENFSKKKIRKVCVVCGEKRGIVKNWDLCRKCVLDGMVHTSFIHQ